MKGKKDYSIVAVKYFIQATRDSGYKGTTAAIAELVDNSIEASATEIDIDLIESENSSDYPFTIIVKDNGSGMSSSTLRLALQFGGSTRFNSRTSMGRYGMGLPNSSLSQSHRVDVYSWTSTNHIWWSYLDIDEIIKEDILTVPRPKRVAPSAFSKDTIPKSGTTIIWSKCDRLDHRSIKLFSAKLHLSLGRMFREYLWKGKILRVNGNKIKPVDPLFYREGNNLVGAVLYGSRIKYEVKIPDSSTPGKTSTVLVTFTELPIEQWHSLSNEEKRTYSITKKAGVSIVRANREIDYGWYFMGSKRKENYDDWWRCEVQFSPDLDELFGVTHTKQGIHPTEIINDVLTLDIEKIAHKLNSRVRDRYMQVKRRDITPRSTLQAGKNDLFLEPPMVDSINVNETAQKQTSFLSQEVKAKNLYVYGLRYKLEYKIIQDSSFFVPIFLQNELTVILNEQHPFFERIYIPLLKFTDPNSKFFRQNIELLLFAIARAETCITNSSEKEFVSNLRKIWSNTLATFLL